MARKREPRPQRFLVQTLLSQPVWRKAWKVAESEGRSMSAWLRHLVTTAVKKKRSET